MKATIRNQKIEGYISQTNWLFVKGIHHKGTYAIAKVAKTDTGYEVVSIEPQQALRDYTNAEIAAALLNAS